MDKQLTVQEALRIVSDRIQYMREEGETDLRSLLWLVHGIKEAVDGGSSASSIIATFGWNEEND